MTRIYAFVAAGIALAFLAGLYVVTALRNDSPGDPYAQCRATTVAGGAKIGGPFTLMDENGATRTDADVITGPTLIYFGYTFCPDVCPLDTARNAEAIEILESRGRMVTPVFISIDPERDTPDVLQAFTGNLHPRMIGLTGTPEQVKAASQAYRTYYQKQQPEAGSEDYYLIDHSTFTYLMLPEVGFAEFFRRDLTPEQVADGVQCFLDAS